MAHPIEIGEATEERMKKELQVLSPLMRLKRMAGKGEKVNMCPFGCTTKNLDGNGYCKHVVGISQDKKFMEPLVRGFRGQRVIRVERDRIPTGEIGEDGEPEFDFGDPKLLPVIDGDQLVRITTCYRVYRDVGNQPKAAIKK